MAFFLSDVVDLPAVLRVRLEPVVGEQVGQVRWFVRVTGREPEWQFPKDSIQPGPGFNFTEFGAGDDAQENGGSIATSFTAHEKPVFTAERGRFHQAFCQIVVNRESTVFRVTAQRRQLIPRVRECFADQTFRQNVLVFCSKPRLEGMQNRNSVLLSCIAPSVSFQLCQVELCLQCV